MLKVITRNKFLLSCLLRNDISYIQAAKPFKGSLSCFALRYIKQWKYYHWFEIKLVIAVIVFYCESHILIVPKNWLQMSNECLLKKVQCGLCRTFKDINT